MEQHQHGSTPRAGSDRLQKSSKRLLSALQLMPISQISTQKYGSGHFDPYKPQEKFVQWEHVLRILNYIFAYVKRMK